MKPWVKVALVTAVFAIPAMALGQVIWPPAPGGPEPTAGQLPFFIFLALFEALTFGLGISFLLFGFAPLKRALGGSTWRTWAAYLAIGWFMVSWWRRRCSSGTSCTCSREPRPTDDLGKQVYQLQVLELGGEGGGELGAVTLLAHRSGDL